MTSHEQVRAELRVGMASAAPAGCWGDLLSDPVFAVRLGDGTRTALALPEVLEKLSGGEEIASFEALRRHQRHAWHALLVQVGAMALQRAGRERVEAVAAATWRLWLLGLSEGSREAWCLVVEDVSKPAWLQAPVPEGRIEALASGQALAADELDLLVTAKNHDLKASRLGQASAGDWALALLSVQTMDGYPGRGNYGIARMNGGLANRPGLAMTAADSWQVRWRRDVQVAIDAAAELATRAEMQVGAGLALLWLPPWDGKDSLALAQCDVLAIEICRRYRLLRAAQGLAAARAPSDKPRLAAKETLGNLGDPWVPIDVAKGSALSLASSGFDYRKVVDIWLSGSFRPAAAMVPRVEDRLWVAAATVRGQGKTEGHHERAIAVPPQVRRRLGSSDGVADLHHRAKDMIKIAGDARNKVLKVGLLVFAQGGADQLDFKDECADAHVDALDRDIDAAFFERLFADVDVGVDAAAAAWQSWLRDRCQWHFARGLDALPCADARRYRARARAELRFGAICRKNFPLAYAADGTPLVAPAADASAPPAAVVPAAPTPEEVSP